MPLSIHPVSYTHLAVYKRQHYLRYSKSYYCVQATLYLAALILSLIFASNPIIVVSITTILALAIAIHSIYFYMTQTKKHSTPYWELF